MSNRKLRNTTPRRKAIFGTTEAAILAAAGINVAGQLAAAGMNAKATSDSAKQQAQAINQQATRQANAIKEQNQRARENQQESQEFIREQNAEARDVQRDIQMQLQMLTGQQNLNDRLEASKIQVKYGGAKRSIAKNGISSPLRGRNIPFNVTDGGGVIPIGTTPEGYDLYELYGNDHEHYHKTKSGKNKTGVGIKFADGNIIEGEGNQGTSSGEKMLVTPTNAYFISKHTLKGFNPAKSVDMGMNPMEAYYLQEQIKRQNGISDDGSNNSPVKKMMGGFSPTDLDYMNDSYPKLMSDIVAPASVGIVYGTRNNKRLACGGKVFRRKAPNGTRWYNDGNFWGAGITALGNLGGALISTIGNKRGARTLADAYTNASNTLADAYRSLQTIDMSTIRNEDYASAHALPAIQAPISQSARPLAALDRQLQRRLSNAARYSASGAAAQERMNTIEMDIQDARNRIYNDDQQQMQSIRQANADRISQAAMRNAELDNKARETYSNAYLNLLRYNNDVVNQRILGAADALSEGTINSANAYAQAQTANSQAWANAIVDSSLGFGNALTVMAKQRANYDNVLVGADMNNKVSTVVIKGDRENAKKLYDAMSAAISDPTFPEENKAEYRRQLALLDGAFNFRGGKYYTRRFSTPSIKYNNSWTLPNVGIKTIPISQIQ